MPLNTAKGSQTPPKSMPIALCQPNKNDTYNPILIKDQILCFRRRDAAGFA
jgi:hypothetical protein